MYFLETKKSDTRRRHLYTYNITCHVPLIFLFNNAAVVKLLLAIFPTKDGDFINTACKLNHLNKIQIACGR